MTFSSAAVDSSVFAQGISNGEAMTMTSASPPTRDATLHTASALGLLHDDKFGGHSVESKDITILRRLKLAILEGQHPYFKANVDLSNLQDLVLASGSRSTGPSAHHSVLEPTQAQSSQPRRTVPPALDDLGSSDSTTLDYGNEDGKGVEEASPEKGLQSSTTSARLEDLNMVNLHDSEKPEQPSESLNHSSQSPNSENRRPSTQTLGRYVLHSPIQSEPGSQMTHARRPSDTPTLVDSSDQNIESEVQIKRESPPYQLSGFQTQADLPSSSIASFTSNSTTSTGITSEDGGAPDNTLDLDGDLVGYNPKYGNKADYIRRQKVRSKAIESIEEKNRRAGYRPEDKPTQKSPVRPIDHGARRGSGPSVSPVRGRNPPSRTLTLTSVSEPSGQRNGSRRTPSLDALVSPNFQTSPLGRPPPPFRPISPTPGTYSTSRRPEDVSPTRDYRQYMSHDDPRSARPRPIVSSPPRGSPPHEPPAPRTTIDRQSLDNYSIPYPRTETRSFDLRPSSPIFSDGQRAAGSYPMDNENNWSSRGLPRAPPPPPPSRNSLPPRDMIHARTPYGSSALPTNPNTGYRPQSLPDPPDARYGSYDSSRRVDWPSNDWDSNSRPTDSKPKLQDRFNVDASWSRDSLESRPLDGYAPRPLRDEFAPHPSEEYASRYRREPSPVASRYAEGFRTGFSRAPDIEGIRPMKRSRPDDGYPARNGPGVERSQEDDIDGRTGYYRRKFAPRDDEYEPRARPPY
ncbi:hypothetical protein V565_064640 [Rhizoctonia solani 123E]|uniref:Uncharacterized protein n=1 Tax=Rhizoctonia solani 123E TaxID=1423351 RepID=A0A074S334_9AGAM|nr:hypothetical protein V565_064640 [Rhizoctonia solani 123E]